MKNVLSAVQRANKKIAQSWPGEALLRQPVHVVYGGAHLFTQETPRKLGELARRAFAENAPTPQDLDNTLGLNPSFGIHEKVAAKLSREPIEDLRIDFEDGYGQRADDEEDRDAERAGSELARAVAAGGMPPFYGVRVKSLSQNTYKRSLRTLDIFLGQIGKKVSPGFVITLPKVQSAEQVSVFVKALETLEQKKKFQKGSLRFEVMIESPSVLINADGACELPEIFAASKGRLVGAHFGAYDYLSACGVYGTNQNLAHPLAVWARNVMRTALAEKPVFLSDGAVITMPIGPHRAPQGGGVLTSAQKKENHAAVWTSWRQSYSQVRAALATGFPQGWDLHPAQVPIRYVAVYSFFASELESASKRMKSFLDSAARASRAGTAFDDAASALGLLNFFRRGYLCGALTEQEVPEGLLSADHPFALAAANAAAVPRKSRH